LTLNKINNRDRDCSAKCCCQEDETVTLRGSVQNGHFPFAPLASIKMNHRIEKSDCATPPQRSAQPFRHIRLRPIWVNVSDRTQPFRHRRIPTRGCSIRPYPRLAPGLCLFNWRLIKLQRGKNFGGQCLHVVAPKCSTSVTGILTARPSLVLRTRTRGPRRERKKPGPYQTGGY
jgi:hypothetical protein